MKKVEMKGVGEYRTIPMSVFEKGIVSFAPEAVIQIVSAANYAVEQVKENAKKAILIADFSTLAKFSMMAVEYAHTLGYNTACEDADLKTVDAFKVELTGDQIATIRAWVDAKIKHCEANRDKETFNETSYFILKDVMYDLRDMLMPQRLDKETEEELMNILKGVKPSIN